MTDSTKLPLNKILQNAQGIYDLFESMNKSLEMGTPGAMPGSINAEAIREVMADLDSQNEPESDPNKIDTTEAQAMAQALAIQLEKPCQ